MLSEESGRGKACTASTELSAAHCSHGCHLTHAWLIRSGGQRTWTFLLNMRCFKYITLLSPHPLPDITMRRSSATCQLPKSICYPATINEASSQECSLFSPWMVTMSGFCASILAPSWTHAHEISLISLPNQGWGRKRGREERAVVIVYHRLEGQDRLHSLLVQLYVK